MVGSDLDHPNILEGGIDFTLKNDQQQAIYHQAKSFYNYLNDQLKPISIESEVSILYTDDEGSVINGTIDLLAETDAGYWIIDHKSDITENLDTRAKEYLPQLLCYQEAISRAQQEKPVLGLIINWISAGIITSCSNYSLEKY